MVAEIIDPLEPTGQTVKKVLIVSPHFPPVNAADMQRTRLALPYLRELGWEPTVLAVDPDSVEGAVIDAVLEKTYPDDIRVIRVHGLPSRYTRWLGIGSLWWRCGRALRLAGDQLLRREKFDLVFFSNTQFDSFTLGPLWRQRYGIPYVLDYQDPWVNDYYRDTGTRPPGGALKFWVSQFNARRREPKVLKKVSRIIAVSPAYGPSLQKRYPWFAASTVRTIPFGTSSLDLETARSHEPSRKLIPFGDGHIHHVYAGRCGDDMVIALTILFRAFKRYLDSHPTEARRHRFHFIGTDYAPAPLGRERVVPVAKREGVASYVNEHCYRVPYFDALNFLIRADALVVIGSDDATYSASKIYPYILARRPLITITHEQSQIATVMQQQRISGCYPFSQTNDIDKLAGKIQNEWFVAGGYQHGHSNPDSVLGKHGAKPMTAALVEVFDDAIHDTSSFSDKT